MKMMNRPLEKWRNRVCLSASSKNSAVTITVNSFVLVLAFENEKFKTQVIVIVRKLANEEGRKKKSGNNNKNCFLTRLFCHLPGTDSTVASKLKFEMLTSQCGMTMTCNISSSNNNNRNNNRKRRRVNCPQERDWTHTQTKTDIASYLKMTTTSSNFLLNICCSSNILKTVQQQTTLLGLSCLFLVKQTSRNWLWRSAVVWRCSTREENEDEN